MADWTRFRGPNGTGVADIGPLPDRFDKSAFAWQTALPGEGHSSPAVVGNRCFVTAADEARGRRSVLCLDTRTGRILWDHPFPFQGYHLHDFNRAASSSPAADSKRVYVLLPEPDAFKVAALTHDGKVVWQRALGPFPTQHGGGASPIVDGDRVIFAAEPEDARGGLYALDAATGATVWKRERDSGPSPYVAPYLRRGAGGRREAVFASSAHGITALDRDTGDLAWELPGLFRLRCVASPVEADGVIVATTGSGGGDRLTVGVRPPQRPGEKPTVLWRLTRAVSYVPTPLVLGGDVLFWGDGGIVSRVRAATGEILWQERVGGNFFGSPIRAGGRIWCLSARGEAVCLADEPAFRLLGKSELGEESHATPAAAGGRLFLRTRNRLTAIASR